MSYKNIETVVAILRVEAERYRTEYDKIIEEKKEAIREVKDTYKQIVAENKIAEISKEYEKRVIDLRVEASKAVEYVEDLRNHAIASVGKSSTSLINKLSFINLIPLTEAELRSVVDNNGVKNDYWASRYISKVAEKNNIDTTLLGMDSSLDTKLSILAQLEGQYHSIVTKYPDADGDEIEAAYLKHAYLNSDICRRAIGIYNNSVPLYSEDTRAERVMVNILAQSSDFERGFAIANALKNSRNEANKNAILYKLSTNQSISDYALQLSGHYSDVNEFKTNSLIQYSEALNGVKSIATTGTREKLNEVLEHIGGNNRFFNEMLKSEAKRNDIVMNLLIDENAEAETVTE